MEGAEGNVLDCEDVHCSVSANNVLVKLFMPLIYKDKSVRLVHCLFISQST